MMRVSAILLVDARGWPLLQERDEHAAIAPNQWGMVGGHVDPDEVFEAAAYRELAEETGIAWTSGLSLWRDEYFKYRRASDGHRYQIWVAGTDLTDEDIVVGEGRRIVFVDPATVAGLDLGEAAAFFVRRFLASETYARMTPTGGQDGSAARAGSWTGSPSGGGAVEAP